MPPSPTVKTTHPLRGDETSEGSGSEDNDNESVTRLVNDIEEQMNKSEPSSQQHVHETPESNDFKHSYHAPTPTDVHTPASDAPTAQLRVEQENNGASGSGAKTPAVQRPEAKSTVSKAQKCTQWFRVHRIPFFKRWSHLPARGNRMSSVSLLPRLSRRQVYTDED